MNCKLGGKLSTEIGAILPLEDLRISNNTFTGTLPTQMGNLVNLKELFAEYNGFTGQIPTQFGNMANLDELYLSGNKLLGGVIPSELAKCTELEKLSLQDTNISGEVPVELAQLSLETVHFQETGITGNLDSIFCTDGSTYDYLEANCGSDALVSCICCTKCCDKNGENCYDNDFDFEY